MSFNNIIVERGDKIARVYINRHKKLNALNKATIDELHSAFTELESDSGIRVVIHSLN